MRAAFSDYHLIIKFFVSHSLGNKFFINICVIIKWLHFGLPKDYKYDGGDDVETSGNREYCSPCSNG